MPSLLTADHLAAIDRLIATGHFEDGHQVISEALAHLENRERQMEDLRAKLQSGRDAIARGACSEYTPELHEQIRQSALQRIQKQS